MNRLRRGKALAAAVWLLLSLCFGCVSLAEDAQEITYIAPKLPISAEPYDETHPELLSVDQLYAKSAILIEANSGKVIFEKNADMQMYPASTTKIMTLLLALMYGDMESTVYLTETDMAGIEEGVDAVMDLEIGESINFLDLLYGTFIRSANEGANLIAESTAGNIPTFVSMMNSKAAELGCTGTHFVNPNGLHDADHYTTARDLSIIARAAMQDERFREIACSYTYSLPKSNLHRSRVLTHSSRKFFNPSLEDNEYYYPFATGIKTGFTSAAGYCFVGSAVRDNVELISVVLYTTENGRWTDTKKLMEYGFSQYISVTPDELYAENPIVLETTGFAIDDEGYGRLQLNAHPAANARDLRITATKKELAGMARTLRQTVSIQYTRSFSAPIEKGEVFGTMTYYPEDGSAPVEYELVASRSVMRREHMPLTLEEIEDMVRSDPNPFPPLTLELLLMLLLPLVLVFLIIRFLVRRFGKKHRARRRTIPKPSGREFR